MPNICAALKNKTSLAWSPGPKTWAWAEKTGAPHRPIWPTGRPAASHRRILIRRRRMRHVNKNTGRPSPLKNPNLIFSSPFSLLPLLTRRRRASRTAARRRARGSKAEGPAAPPSSAHRSCVSPVQAHSPVERCSTMP